MKKLSNADATTEQGRVKIAKFLVEGCGLTKANAATVLLRIRETSSVRSGGKFPRGDFEIVHHPETPCSVERVIVWARTEVGPGFWMRYELQSHLWDGSEPKRLALEIHWAGPEEH